jgi:hypothetical protein
MGKTRVCGARCHHAKRAKCMCWCGGLFHGAAGADARDTFAESFDVDKLPTTERAFDELTRQPDLFQADDGGRWRQAIQAARQARV